MSNEIAKLVVAFEAQSAQYTQSVGKLIDQNKRFADSATTTVNKVRSAFTALGGAFLVREAVEFVDSQVKAVAALGKVADSAGLGVEQLQRLQFAFKSLTTLTDQTSQQGLNIFNKNLGLARTNSGKLRDAFVSLGVDVSQTASVAIEQAITGLSKISDSSDRAAKAAVIFSSRFGPKMAGALNEGLRKFDEVRAKLNLLITDAEAEKAKELEETFARLGHELSTTFTKSVLDGSDALMDLSKAFGFVVSVAGTFLGVLHGIADETARRAFGNPDHSNDPQQTQSGQLVRDSNGKLIGLTQNGEPAPPPIHVVTDADKMAMAAAKAQADWTMSIYDSVNALTQQAAELKMTATQAALFELDISGISPKLREQAVAAIDAIDKYKALQAEFKKIDDEDADFQRGIDASYSTANTTFKKMSVSAQEAARNIQDAFAEFLFNPFEGGVKGMLQNFLDVLRRMAAEMAASAIFSKLGGLKGSGGILGLIGTFAASATTHAAVGASYSGGHAILVGERGPEMMVPSSSGTVVPNGAFGGGVVINQNFTVGDVATRSQLVAGMSMAKDSAKKEIFELIRRGRI